MAILPILYEVLQDEQVILSTLQQEAAIINSELVVKLSQEVLDGTTLSLQQLYILQRMVSDLATSLAQFEATITPRIGTPQQAGQPVTLPATPPTGYGGPALSDIGDEVWTYPLPGGGGFTALDAQATQNTWQYLAQFAGFSWASFVYPGYRLEGTTDGADNNVGGPSNAALDFGTILASDGSLLAWAQRAYPATVWHAGGDGIVYETDPRRSDLHWQIDLTELQFRQWQALASGAIRVPPVWPGVANVTLGAVQALADGLTVPGPLDGVIVKIASVPTPVGFYPFGARKSFVHVGGIIFIDDDGEAEQAQPLGLDDEVICPRYQTRADIAIIRLKSGVTGTVQPWTVT